MTEIRPEKITGTDKKAAAGKGIGDAFRRAQDHSRRVRLLKLALPVVSLLIIAAFFGYSWLMTPGSVSVDVTGTAYADGKLVMANPKLDGYTKENLPYSMTATRAIQDVQNTSQIQLEEIEARLPIDDKNTASVVAAKGTYDNVKNTLVIDSAIKMTTTDGMVAEFTSANVDMAGGSLKTDKPVKITMNRTEIQADSMDVIDNGKVMVFERRVRVNIAPEDQNTANARSGDANAAN